MQQKYRFASNLSFSWRCHFPFPFINEGPVDSRRNSVTLAGLVYDVTDTDVRSQNGSVHGRVFATFKRPFLTD